MFVRNILLKNNFDIIDVVCFCPGSKQESEDIVKWCRKEYGKSHTPFYSCWWTTRKILPYSKSVSAVDYGDVFKSSYTCVIIKKSHLTPLTQLTWG